MTYDLYLATANSHKVQEFAQLLSDTPLRVLPAGVIGGMPAVEESAETFAGNALLKAQALHTRAPAGAWVMADDSGLETDALQGAPGVHSARFAGPAASDAENCRLLLHKLQQAGTDRRSARFRCVLALLGPQGNVPLYFSGSCEGKIACSPSGDGGFGYDPLFIPSGYEDSFAALPAQIKATLSHRANAIRKFAEWLSASLS